VNEDKQQDKQAWRASDSNHLASMVVVVLAVGAVVGFLIWLNYFLNGIGS
jgi:hypothetical protein